MASETNNLFVGLSMFNTVLYYILHIFTKATKFVQMN